MSYLDVLPKDVLRETAAHLQTVYVLQRRNHEYVYGRGHAYVGNEILVCYSNFNQAAVALLSQYNKRYGTAACNYFIEEFQLGKESEGWIYKFVTIDSNVRLLRYKPELSDDFSLDDKKYINKLKLPLPAVYTSGWKYTYNDNDNEVRETVYSERKVANIDVDFAWDVPQ